MLLTTVSFNVPNHCSASNLNIHLCVPSAWQQQLYCWSYCPLPAASCMHVSLWTQYHSTQLTGSMRSHRDEQGQYTQAHTDTCMNNCSTLHLQVVESGAQSTASAFHPNSTTISHSSNKKLSMWGKKAIQSIESQLVNDLSFFVSEFLIKQREESVQTVHRTHTQEETSSESQ